MARFAVVLAGVLAALYAGAGERVRESALAGSWYPADAAALADYVDGLLDGAGAPQTQSQPVRALVLPHAGYAFSGETAAAALALVRGGRYGRVIVLAPSHRAAFHGLSVADADAYATPLGEVAVDGGAVAVLRSSSLVTSDPAAHRHEHAIEIELPLLQRALAPGWKLVPVLVGELDEADYPATADLLRPLADGATLVVVSSDFTHFGPRFGYLPFAPDAEAAEKIRGLDEGALERILARDGPGLLRYQGETGITICGYRALALLLDLLPADAQVRQVAYATSGALTGDWLNSVSYLSLAVSGPTAFSEGAQGSAGGKGRQGIREADLRLLHRLASLGVKRAVFGQSAAQDAEIRAALADIPPELEAPGGAFVTLWHHGMLRGCVGYVLEGEERKPLYRAVLENGINAARSDHRFRPLSAEELADLEVEVSVLSPPQPIASAEDFRPGEEGVILQKDGHYALFLPEVATEMGWDREETLAQLAQKAGLPPDAWRDGATFEVFTTTRYEAPYRLPAPETAAVDR
jgi:MEMO1 family protein